MAPDQVHAGRLLGAALCAALIALAGCASSIARRPTGTPAGNQGASWEAVLPGREIGPILAGAESPEAGRRDASLNIRSSEPLLAQNTWPEAPRPSLDRRRILNIPDQADQVLYFSDRPGFDHPTRWWWWR